MQSQGKPKSRPMVDLLISIILPSLILMKLSGDDALGPAGGLIVALSLPFAWGAYDGECAAHRWHWFIRVGYEMARD